MTNQTNHLKKNIIKIKNVKFRGRIRLKNLYKIKKEDD